MAPPLEEAMEVIFEVEKADAVSLCGETESEGDITILDKRTSKWKSYQFWNLTPKLHQIFLLRNSKRSDQVLPLQRGLISMY